jgi:hypothetical protein
MENLAVQIVRFVEDTQPGVVACEFVDAEGRRYTLVDKVPAFSAERLDAASAYPQPGVVRCEVVSRWRDGRGRELVRVTADKPDGIESTEGLAEFVVLSSQLLAAR